MYHVIMQHDQRDCGAACISMISRSYGKILPLSIARSMTKTDHVGTNLFGIVDAAKQLGFESDALNGTPEEILSGITDKSITFPLIAHITNEDGFSHFVVLFAYRRGSFIVGDPGKGKRTITVDNFIKCWTGYIVTFQPTERFQKDNRRPKSLLRYAELLKGQSRKLFFIFILSVLITTFSIITAIILQDAVDSILLLDITGFDEDMIAQDEDTALTTDAIDDIEVLDLSEVQEEKHEESDYEDEHDHESEPFIIRIEEAISKKINMIDLSIVFLLLMTLYIIQYLIHYFRAWMIVQMSRNIDQKLTLTFLNHILDIPINDISRWQTGEYLSRFSDASAIRNAISTVVVTLTMDTLMAAASAAFLILIEPRMFCVSLLVVMLYFVLILFYQSPIKNASRDVMQNNARVESYFKESIDGIETIRGINAASSVKRTAAVKFHSFLDAVVKSSLINLSQETIVSAVDVLGTVGVLWIGLGLARSGSLSIGNLLGFYVFMGYFTNPLKNLIELQPTLQNASVAAERLNDVLDIQVEKNSGSIDNERKEYKSWSMAHVDFRYGNHELALTDVSLYVNRGEKIGIVGENGCGKTTIAKLFLKFFDPERGTISADMLNYDSIDPAKIRSMVSFVSQNTFLFSDTIRHNLLLGMEHVEDKDLEDICRKCRLDEMVRNMPHGLDTVLDENGFNLSGGQRQRIAIARALLKKPQLLILDEATSNIDKITEETIWNNVDQMIGNMACIIISHKLSSIKACDRIYLIREGKIIATGVHNELLQNAYYRSLWNNQ